MATHIIHSSETTTCYSTEELQKSKAGLYYTTLTYINFAHDAAIQIHGNVISLLK